MHEIIFYKDNSGKESVYELIRELSKNDNKENRIRLNKINDYIQVLSTYGIIANDNYMKHLDGDIWELRPRKDRILFFSYVNGSFVLLHDFVKKLKKPLKEKLNKQKEN